MAKAQAIASSNRKEYTAWRGMLNRCYNPNERAYRWYGAIGRYVCKRWRDSFEAFLTDLGPRPDDGYSLDRINTDGCYTCGKCEECREKGDVANCRWATQLEQVQNAKSNLRFTRNGETKILKEWCRQFGLTYRVVHRRICDYGWSFEKAITTPIIKCPKDQLITFRGESLTMIEWTARLGLSRNAIRQRLKKYGWSIERALTTPPQVSTSRRES